MTDAAAASTAPAAGPRICRKTRSVYVYLGACVCLGVTCGRAARPVFGRNLPTVFGVCRSPVE